MTIRRLSILLAAGAIIVASGVAWTRYRAASQRQAASSAQERDLEIFDLLERSIELPVEPRPLEKFAAALSAATGVPVTLDAEAVEFAGKWHSDGLNVETPWPRMSAAAHLSLALAPLELGWTVRRGEILITTPEKLLSLPPLVATYALPQPELAEQRADASTWAELIKSLIEPDSWDDIGGIGHCEPAGGAIVVAHRPEVHRQIRALLDGLTAHDEPPRSLQPVVIWPNAESTDNQRALARLGRPASIDCVEMPLADLMKFLADEHDVPIVLATKKLSEAGVSPDTSLTLRIDRMTLGSLLCHVLREVELTYVVRAGLVQITTPEDAEERLMTVAYPVHDLVQPRPFAGYRTGDRDYDSLIELIKAVAAPDSWDDRSGPSSLDHVGGWLIIPQTAYVHARIERLLHDLRSALWPGDTPLVFGSRQQRKFEDRIFAALDRRIALSYAGRKLRDVCDDVASQLGVPVLLSNKKLEEAGVSTAAPITGEFPPAPAAVQLARILEPLDLAFAVGLEAILITTPEQAEGLAFPRVYDVRSLIEPGVSLPGMNEGRCVLDLVESHVWQTSWDNVGGPGAADMYCGLLVVSQTLNGHREVAAFLNELRRATRLHREREVPPAEPDQAEQRTLAALDRPLTLDYENVPLRDVAKSLERQLEVPVRANEKRLLDAHNIAAQATTCHFPLAPTRVQLDRLCDLFNLEYEIRDGVLTLTDRQAAGFTTRVYDARSLVREPDGLFVNDLPSGRWATRQSLDDALTRAVKRHPAPGQWDEFGGPGSANCLGGMLVVTQTRRGHEQVESLLAMLRKAAAATKPSEEEPGEHNAAGCTDMDSLLERETAVHLHAETVGQAADQLAEQFQLPVFLHPMALAAEEQFEAPWVLDLPVAPVWQQLERLEEIRVAGRPRVRDGYIVLLWSESAGDSFSTRCYDIAWLRAALPALFGRPEFRQELIYWPYGFEEYETLNTIMIEYAAISDLAAARDTLIVSESHAGHRQIREVLSKLKSYIDANPTPPQSAAALLDELEACLESLR